MLEAASRPGKRSRIVLTTFGSLGDLHPYLALGRGLQQRGHIAIIATSEQYRPKVESVGLPFHALRPDMPDLEANRDLIRRVMDLRVGPETVIREIAIPALRPSYEDLLVVGRGADVMVSHPLTFATRLAAEKLGVPWVSSMLAPLGFFSAHSPPVLPAAAGLAQFRWLGPVLHRPLFRFMRWYLHSWTAPWHHLRAEIGLPPTDEEPLFDGQNAPRLVLALFSGLLGPKAPDWPAQTVVTGFPFHDQGTSLPHDLERFLDAGPPPVVFTLGSSAVHDAGPFYDYAAQAAARLGLRAVLLVGTDPRNRPAALPTGVAAFEYAPYAALFPRAAAIVHQGGVGTTAESMRAGRPMLVMPYAHDQPDNADRVARLGIARVIPRHRFKPGHLASELKRLLGMPQYATRAAEVGTKVRSEDGVGMACVALEEVLVGTR